jgi:glycosyltransferase involved in cell wall biosynthesis
MAIEEFRPGMAAHSEQSGSIAVLAPRRERLAIISTYNKLCGIAAYTQALERQLADIFDVTIFDLDQDLLRSRHRRVRQLGDRHIKEICEALAGFDAVNLQLEYGTLGRATRDICRRFSWLVAAAPRLSVTFHSVKRSTIFPHADHLWAIFTAKFRTAADIRREFRRNRQLSLGIVKRLRRAQRRKPVSIIVHTRRDAADFRLSYGFERVFDHPLSFLSSAEIDAILSEATRRRFPLLDGLPAPTVLVGVFGFLNDYKGFGTAIRALYHLPKTHHLLIFGGIHPNEIAPHQPIHPYLRSLLDDAHVEATLGDRSRAGAQQGSGLADFQPGADPRDLSDRVHFMGALDDADFLAGMAICDTVVFPYLEVGQSSSGAISNALEMGRRIIASRTHTFLEFAAYHPGAIELFDIGNHLELAGRILARPQYAARRELSRYTIESNKALYLVANSAPDSATSRIRRRVQPPPAGIQRETG